MFRNQAGARPGLDRSGARGTEFSSADYRNFGFQGFPRHAHETFSIGIIESGVHQFWCGRGSAQIMPTGTLCAINPQVMHASGPATSGEWRCRVFYPSSSVIARALGANSEEWALDRHIIDDPGLFRELEHLHTSSQLRETLLERETRIAAFLRRLFERHGNASPDRSQARVAPRTVQIIRDYLHAQAESEVSIAELAEAAGVSSTQVVRAFSAETGMPPHWYLISLRVGRAKALLRAGISPGQAALQVGFSDQSQLTRHFKRLTGLTAGRFAAEASPANTDQDLSAPIWAKRRLNA
jgi:AraC-like DNA-binding protein